MDDASQCVMMISSSADGIQALPSSLLAGEGNPHAACAPCECDFPPIPRAIFRNNTALRFNSGVNGTAAIPLCQEPLIISFRTLSIARQNCVATSGISTLSVHQLLIVPQNCHPESLRLFWIASPSTTAGCPIQARFWLEWDTTALDSPFLSSRPAGSLPVLAQTYPSGLTITPRKHDSYSVVYTAIPRVCLGNVWNRGNEQQSCGCHVRGSKSQ